MKLKEIMTTPVESIDSNSPMAEAAKKMRDADVGMLAVMERDEVIGVVTDRDLVVRGLTEGGINKSVRDVMTPNPISLDKDSEVDEAIRTMESNGVGRLVITDGASQAVGVVSAGAIAVACRGQEKVGELASELSAAHRGN